MQLPQARGSTHDGRLALSIYIYFPSPYLRSPNVARVSLGPACSGLPLFAELYAEVNPETIDARTSVFYAKSMSPVAMSFDSRCAFCF